MVGENTNAEDQLLPDRYPQHDLFICDVADAVLKDIMQEMEHPFYSLSKKPETNIRRYEHNGNWLQVVPSVKGLATIYDKDILIYCISQIMHKLNRGEPVSKRVRINSRDLLIFTNRGTSGRDYMALADALERIRGTTITTNIRSGDEEQIDTFGLIDSSAIRRKHGLDGRLLWCEVTLSDWVFNAIRAKEVLTLHRDYFRLRKPIERRVYELARKHCGREGTWKVSTELLHKKSGSKADLKEFRRALRHLAQHNHLPDYHLEVDDERDQVIFRNRGTLGAKATQQTDEVAKVQLASDTYHEARKCAPGWDVYVLEREWREWMTEPPRYPDRAFLGFCRKWYEKRGEP
jgi:plasmid replication initiation protein